MLLRRDVVLETDDILLRFAFAARRWVLLGAAVGLLLGAYSLMAQPPVYRSTASVQLSEASPSVRLSSAFGLGAPITIDTDAQLLTSDAVLDAVAARVGVTRQQARDSLSVIARVKTQVLEITYGARTPDLARDGAQQAAGSLLAQREELINDRLRQYLRRLESAGTTAVPGLSGADAVAVASAAEGNRRRAILLSLRIPNPGTVIEGARVPARADRGSVEIPLVSGAALGACVGLLFGVFVVRSSSTGRLVQVVVNRSAFWARLARAPATPLWGEPVTVWARRGAERAGEERRARRRHVAALGRSRLRGRRRIVGVVVAVVVATACGAAAGIFVTNRNPQMAVGQTSVLLAPLAGNPFTAAKAESVVAMRTESQVPLSQPVIERVAESGVTDFDARKLRQTTKVQSLPNTQILVISALGRSREQAAQTSHQLASQTLSIREDRARRAVDEQLKAIKSDIDEATQDFFAAASKDVGTARLNQLTERLVFLNRQMRDLDVLEIDAGSVISTSSRVQERLLTPARLVPLCALAGGLIGFLLSVSFVRLRRRAVQSPRRAGSGGRHGRGAPPSRAVVPTPRPAGAQPSRPSSAAPQAEAPAERTTVERVGRAGALSVVGASVATLAGVVTTAVITNVLDRSDAGAVFATTAAFLMALAIVQLGTDVGLVWSIPTLLVNGQPSMVRPVLRSAAVVVLGVSTVVAIVAFLAADDLAGLLAANDRVPDVAAQLRVLAVFLPAAALFNTVLAGTRATRTMVPTVAVDLVGRNALQLLLVSAVLFAGWGTLAVVLAWSLPYAVLLAVAFWWLHVLLTRKVPRESAGTPDASQPGSPRQGVRSFWRFTGPRGIASTSQTALKRLDIVLVAALRSPAEAALYAAASRFVVVGQVGVQALQQAMSPHISALASRRDRAGVQEVYQATTTWSIALAWPLYLSCAALAPELLRLFGREYPQAAPVVVVLSCTMLLATACGPVDTILLMSGRSWLSLFNNISALVVNVALNLVFIPQAGALGAAWAWAVALGLRNALPLAQVRVFQRIRLLTKPVILTSVANIVCFGPAVAGALLLDASVRSLCTLLAIGLLCYVAILWRFRAVVGLEWLFAALRPRRQVLHPSGVGS